MLNCELIVLHCHDANRRRHSGWFMLVIDDAVWNFDGFVY